MFKINFSILIPNLGYSEYLFDCLKSISNQKNDGTFTFEVIVCDQSDETIYEINKEKSSKILSEANISFDYYRSEIKSLYFARHNLMSKANGEYIIFVDSDDLVSDDYLTNLSQTILENNKPDMVIFRFKKFSNDSCLSSTKTEENIFKKISYNPKSYFYYSSYINNVVTKVFKKELYSIDDYCDETDHKIGEDKYFSYPLVKKTKTIVFNNDQWYLYRINETSMTHSLNFEKITEGIDSRFAFFDENPSSLNLAILSDDLMTYCIAILSLISDATTKKEVLNAVRNKVREHRLHQSLSNGLKHFIFYILLKFKMFNLLIKIV